MCLIVVKDEAKSSFSVEDFKRSHARNADGLGIMYIEDDRIKVAKILGNLKTQLKLYYTHMHREKFVLHHRFSTHGSKNLENCHPFKVLSIDDGDPMDLYMVHNGTFNMNKFSKDCDKTLSDTNLFVREYMTPILRKCPEMLDEVAFQCMIHDYIGTSNKLVFLNNLGEIMIFNKDQGTVKNGCWLSNTYSVAPAVDYSYANSYGKHNNAYHSTVIEKEDAAANDYSNIYGGWHSDEYWHKGWNEHVFKKATEQSDTLTTLDQDVILEIATEYSGLSLETIEKIVIDDPSLAYDMLCVLEGKEIDETILDEPASTIATQLYNHLQDFSKRQAA